MGVQVPISWQKFMAHAQPNGVCSAEFSVQIALMKVAKPVTDDAVEEAAPREFAALRALIGERAATLPRRLTQVATYALQNPDEIAFGTAASIAAHAGVQPSTLVRFSQALG